jgi:hypothetical protein
LRAGVAIDSADHLFDLHEMETAVRLQRQGEEKQREKAPFSPRRRV